LNKAAIDRPGTAAAIANGRPLRPMRIKNVNVTVARMLTATGEDRHLGQASTSMIRLCKKAWTRGASAFTRVFDAL
jgi:hypothetical protein